MAHTITCPRCRKTLTVSDDAPASGLACPSCLAPLPDRERTEIQTAPAARPVPSPSRLAAEEFAKEGRRDLYLGAAILGGAVLLCVFGLVLHISSASRTVWREQFLPLFGLFDLFVVSVLTVWSTRSLRGTPGGASAKLLQGCTVLFIFLIFLVAGFIFFGFVCGIVAPFRIEH